MSHLPFATMPNALATDPPQRTERSVHLRELPPRRDWEGATDVFERLNAPEGGACVRNCDCADGLVCRQGSCVADW